MNSDSGKGNGAVISMIYRVHLKILDEDEDHIDISKVHPSLARKCFIL